MALCSRRTSSITHRTPPNAAVRSRRRCVVDVRAAAQAEAQPAAAAAASRAAALKADIIAMSGQKYGHDLDPAAREAVVAKVKELEGLQLPVKASLDALTGSQWTTVFTTSDGTSSGQVGFGSVRFITDVTQEFPPDQPGTYFNVSRLGLVSARLRGVFSITRDDRIDLEFKDLALRIGPLKAAEKVFEAGAMKGFWRLSYCDAEFRVFYTNKQNMFVLRRL